MAVILGHSQAKYLHHYIKDHDILTLAYPGSRVDHLWSKCEDVVPSFDVVAILAGANDIPNCDAVTVLHRLQKLCETIHAVNPRVKVLVSDILPRAQTTFSGEHLQDTFLSQVNDRASDVNTVMREVSRRLSWVDYIEFPKFQQHGSVQRHLLSRDGLHLSFEGTKYVADTIRDKIRNCLSRLSLKTSKTFETYSAEANIFEMYPEETTSLEILKEETVSQEIIADTIFPVIKSVSVETYVAVTTNIELQCITSSQQRQQGGGCENGDAELKTGDTFASYSEFKDKFESWCMRHGFPMKVGGSDKIANSTPAHPYSSLRYVCKHYGKPRIRGDAKRPVRQYLATGCEAVLRLHLDSSGKKYKITKMITEHNHSISPSTLPMYSTSRALNATEIEEVKPFFDMKVESKQIKQYLKEKTGKKVMVKDINNLKQKVRVEQNKGRTQGQILSDILNELVQKDPGATTVLETDENSDMNILFIQTSEMKQMFADFPGMIFMDNTYNVNSEGYVLNAILAEDQDGTGKPVAYTYMHRETKENFRRVIEIFCENNDTSKINVIMVDKDLTEISVLTEMLPQIHIQICSFHVIKYFKSKVAKLDEKRDVKSDLMQLLRSILYSPDEETYNERRTRLHEEFSFFAEYFDENWHTCRDKWVRCYQKKVRNYGNFTNNKIESHNEKIKQYVSRYMHLPESVKNLIQSIKDSYERSTYKKFLNIRTRIDTSCKDNVRNQYAALCVHPAFDIIRGELNKMNSIDHNSEKTEHGICVTSVSDNRKYNVDASFSSCSCTIWENYGLPCRHIFVCRKNEGQDLFDQTLVDIKWKRSTALGQSAAPLTFSPNIIQRKNGKKSMSKMSPIDKYLKATEFFKELATFLSTCGETEFCSKLDYLKDLKENWMINKDCKFPDNATSYTEMDFTEHEDCTYCDSPIESENVEMENTECRGTIAQSILSEATSMINTTEQNLSEETACPETLIIVETAESPTKEPSKQTDEVNNHDQATTEKSEEAKVCQPADFLQTENDDKDLTKNAASETSSTTYKNVFHPVNIPLVKSRIGRPKGSTKPFWEFSKSRKSLSLRNLKRKGETVEKEQKQQKTESENTYSNKTGIIEIENDDGHNSTDDINAWLRTEVVSMNMDCKALIDGGQMLDDRIILGSQNILKAQFPEINGFQPTVLNQGEISFAPMQRNMVQILFKGSSKCGHWLTISTMNLKPGYVNVYDSLNLEPDNEVKNQICAIMKHESTYVTVNKVSIQQQQGSADCGLFAIATSVAVCHGYEPNKILFRQDKMRSHLVSCLESGQFTMFPFDINIRQKKTKSQKVRVYCRCRRPHDGSPMVKCQNCSEWFHVKCVDIVNEPFFCGDFCSEDYKLGRDQ